LTAAACAALAAAACRSASTAPAKTEALRGSALGLVVDSLVIPPFERGYGVQINAPDLNQFHDRFEAALVTPGRKAYPSTPTTLPNTVTLSGTLLGYDTHEQSAEGMFLRTIDVVLEVLVRVGNEKEPALRLIGDYSYQKLYRTAEGIPALEFDLGNAAREATGVIAGVLAPPKAEPLRPETAVDSPSGIDYSHPWLAHGNREAREGHNERAIATWSLLLFNPVLPDNEDGFRVSERTLAHLQQAGASATELAALKPLARRRSVSLETLQQQVVKALGPNSPLEPKVLQLSDESADRVQMNLSRAHYNLGIVYRQLRRFDLAAFHLCRAYGYDPKPEYLHAWVELQTRRNMIPKTPEDRPEDGLAWLQAYQRVPEPFDATVAGSVYDRNVMPAPAFAPDVTPLKEPPRSGVSAMPAAVVLPPPAPPQPKAGTGAAQPARTIGQPAAPRQGSGR
jgi:hypothetical protein